MEVAIFTMMFSVDQVVHVAGKKHCRKEGMACSRVHGDEVAEDSE